MTEKSIISQSEEANLSGCSKPGRREISWAGGWLRRCSILGLLTGQARAGVPENDAYPMIEYWMANDYSANPLCDAGQSSPALMQTTEFPYRKSLGLRRVSQVLLEEYAKTAAQGRSDIVFDASQRVMKQDFDSLVRAAMSKTIARVRQGTTLGVDEPAGISTELCSMLKTSANSVGPVTQAASAPRSDTAQFCGVMKEATKSLYCQDNYSYQDLAHTYANDLWGAVSSVPNPTISPSCYSAVAALQNPLDLTIQQYRITPDALDWTLLNANEKKVFYLLWKSIEFLERYAERKLAQVQLKQTEPNASPGGSSKSTYSIHEMFEDNEIFTEILPEWKLSRIVYTNEASATTNLRIPLAAISSGGTDSLLVTIRRPLTNYDSRFALYNQLSFKYLYNFTGQLHDGSSTYFQTLLAPIVREIDYKLAGLYDNARLTGESTPLLKLTITAADMPGIGTAAALGNHISRQFGSTVQVDVIVFGTPYFGDSEFLESLKNNVELRVIEIEGDSTDLVACSQTLSCDHNDLYIRTGIESGIVYNYQKAHGYIKIPLNELARYHSAWSSEGSWLQLAAIRDCGYSCVLSNTACLIGTATTDQKLCDPAHCPSFV